MPLKQCDSLDYPILTSQSTTFNGVGYLELPWNCTEGSAAVNGTLGSGACSMMPTNFTGYNNLDYMPRLPHSYYTRSCTINSINVTNMAVKEYTVDAAAKTANLRIYNPGPNDEYRIPLVDVKTDGSWHACNAGADILPWQLVSCQYQLDGMKELGLKLQWYCDDRNPDHAYVDPHSSVRFSYD